MAAKANDLSRRDFLRRTAAAAGLVAAGGTALITACERSGGRAVAPFAPHASAGPQALRNPLYLPPVLTPNGALLTAQTAQVDLGGGQFSSALTYNGLFPGPTFRARRNDTVSVQLQNGLADPTTIHWHGMVVPHLADGHPLQAVAAAEVTSTFRYQVSRPGIVSVRIELPPSTPGARVFMRARRRAPRHGRRG